MSQKGPHQGKPSGDALADLSTLEDFHKAMDCHKKVMGSRYIEVFPCKREEMEWILSRSAGGGGGGSSQITDQSVFVRLRGLPFGCTKEDIRLFFKGQCTFFFLFSPNCCPPHCHFLRQLASAALLIGKCGSGWSKKEKLLIDYL